MSRGRLRHYPPLAAQRCQGLPALDGLPGFKVERRNGAGIGRADHHGLAGRIFAGLLVQAGAVALYLVGVGLQLRFEGDALAAQGLLILHQAQAGALQGLGAGFGVDELFLAHLYLGFGYKAGLGQLLVARQRGLRQLHPARLQGGLFFGLAQLLRGGAQPIV